MLDQPESPAAIPGMNRGRPGWLGMDQGRLDILKDPERLACVPETTAALILELIDDHDKCQATARSLITAAGNLGNIDGIDTGIEALDALINAGASCLVEALRTHPDAEHGIRCDVSVQPEGREASVFVQWGVSANDIVSHIVHAAEWKAHVKSSDKLALGLAEGLDQCRKAISDAIAASDNGSASDAVQEMLLILRPALEAETGGES